MYFASVGVQAFDLSCAFELVCVCLCVSIPPFFHTRVHLLCGHHPVSHNVPYYLFTFICRYMSKQSVFSARGSDETVGVVASLTLVLDALSAKAFCMHIHIR